jgi:hypothetical protein
MAQVMRIDPVWAAQYVYLDELWRGRERVVYDPVLAELLLAHAGESLGWDGDGRVHDMLEDLLSSDAGAVWLLFDDLAAVTHSGIDSHVLGARGLEEGPWLVRRRPWENVLVDIGELRHVTPGARRPAGRAGALCELLSEVAESLSGERTVALWARAQSAFGPHGMTFESFCAWVGTYFPTAMTVGLATTSTACAYSLGCVTPRRGSAESGDLNIELDNRLGSESPQFAYYVAVVSEQRLVLGSSDTMTLLELPARALDFSPAEVALGQSRGPEESELFARITALENELSEVEQRKMEILRELDHATSRVSELEDELEDLRDPPGLSDAEGPAPAVDSNEPAAKALVLQASWELEQLRAQVASLRGRPVEELEAENARLRAELAAFRGGVTAAQGEKDSQPVRSESSPAASEIPDEAPSEISEKGVDIVLEPASDHSNDIEHKARVIVTHAEDLEKWEASWRKHLSSAQFIRGGTLHVEGAELLGLAPTLTNVDESSLGQPSGDDHVCENRRALAFAAHRSPPNAALIQVRNELGRLRDNFKSGKLAALEVDRRLTRLLGFLKMRI